MPPGLSLHGLPALRLCDDLAKQAIGLLAGPAVK
jgi:hypothetical protein